MKRDIELNYVHHIEKPHDVHYEAMDCQRNAQLNLRFYITGSIIFVEYDEGGGGCMGVLNSYDTKTSIKYCPWSRLHSV